MIIKYKYFLEMLRWIDECVWFYLYTHLSTYAGVLWIINGAAWPRRMLRLLLWTGRGEATQPVNGTLHAT